MNLKEYYKERLNERLNEGLNEGLFNKYNPIVRAVTGIGNLIRGRPFGGGTHEITSVPRRDPRMWTRKDSETIEKARQIANTREKIMRARPVYGLVRGDPILEPGRIPNPEIVQQTQDEIDTRIEDPRWKSIADAPIYDAAIQARPSASNRRRNSSTSYSNSDERKK